jgi:hypothetical protein
VEKQHASQPTTEAKTLGIKKRRSILDTDALLIEIPYSRNDVSQHSLRHYPVQQ